VQSGRRMITAGGRFSCSCGSGDGTGGSGTGGDRYLSQSIGEYTWQGDDGQRIGELGKDNGRGVGMCSEGTGLGLYSEHVAEIGNHCSGDGGYWSSGDSERCNGTVI
jgi:hypothetical protein